MGSDQTTRSPSSPGAIGHATAIVHIPALDGLRGVAILLVLMEHFGVGAAFGERTGSSIGLILDRIFYVGWSGVDLFFVLSGFLITSILVASREMPRYYSRFYGRRALRILPLYYTLVVLVVFLIPHAVPSQAPLLVREAVAGQIWLWTYTLNIAVVFGWVGHTGLLAHFWSLAIEEQYYLVWPMLVKKFRTRILVTVCLVLLISALALRIAWLALGWGWQGASVFTLSRADGIAIGALIALLVDNHDSRRRLTALAPLVLATGIAVLGIMFLSVPRFYATAPIVLTLGQSLLALSFGSLLIRAIGPSPSSLLSLKSLRAVGKYSYGTYVWHWPLQQIFILNWPIRTAPSLWVGGLEAAAFMAGGVAGSLFLGWASYQLIERHFLRLKKYFSYRQTSVVKISTRDETVNAS